MDKLKLLVQQNILRDLEIKLKEAKLDGLVIPEVVFEIMKDLEDSYLKEKSDFEKKMDNAEDIYTETKDNKNI